ncbi:trypsin-like serine peptidase [Streptomyces sp. NPDC058394]|uniref:trypsin-like serine peptidase n=1 Tax=Streptomyces sp. NPDC058394 TaxID=3346477 RepID=UPI00364EC9F9
MGHEMTVRGGRAGKLFGSMLWVAVALLLTLTGCQSKSADTPRSVGEFTEPKTWSSSDMAQASPYDMTMPDGADVDERVSDPEPKAVPAEPEQAPYVENAAVLGKVFFDTPAGRRVCSGTAVTDSAAPGASSLVWTAGHCVHTGRTGTFYRNIVFVPSFNNEALSAVSSADTGKREISPLGVWWADRAAVSTGWAREGEEIGGAGAAFDYAVLHVRRSGDPTASLEKTIGFAIPVVVGAPAITKIPTLKVWGYPAEAPFGGNLLFSCQDRPGRLSIAEKDPTLYRIGCTMNGGASGGGWFMGRDDGTLALISNTSVGPNTTQWLAGPRLGNEAEKLLSTVGAGKNADAGTETR